MTDWNELAMEYSGIHSLMDWRLGYSVVEEMLGEIKGKRMLDYGCGSGQFTRRIRDLGAIVNAVDCSQSAIDIAKQKNAGGIDYQVVVDDNLPSIEMIDKAVATFVFCTMQEDTRIRHIASQIYSKLRPDGDLIILEPHPESLGYEYVSMERERPEVVKSGTPIRVKLAGMDTPFNDYWRSKDDYVRILNDTGFEIEAIEEPLVENCLDEVFWRDERIQPPLLIVHAKKVLHL